jgi:hypothetical protein
MFQYETLIFTGRGVGSGDKELRKVIGKYFFLGRFNADRTVVAAIQRLCRQQGNCNSFEIYMQIKADTGKLIASRQFPKEFPDPSEEYEYLSTEEVEKHISSVLHRSKERSENNFGKFIPGNIRRVPGTAYIIAVKQERENFQ